MNMLNYARYGSYYLHQMKNKEVIYLGLNVTVLMQGQNWYNIRTPTDHRAEQKLNKQAKTVGRIKKICCKYQCNCQVDTESVILGRKRQVSSQDV